MSRSEREMLRARISSFLQDVEGAALLEGAVVLPFVIVLSFGTLEFAHYFQQQHLVSTGVWDAATYLARNSDPTTSAAQTAAQNLAATGSIAGGSYRRVRGFDPADVNISFTFVADDIGVSGLRPYRQGPEGGNNLRIVHVTGSYTWVPWGFFFGFGTKNITVTHSERFVGNG
jgi:hypothetical protein